MSDLVTYSRRIAVTAAGIGLIGVGLATGAFAAPGDAPAPPKADDLPVPVVYQPVDASGGLLGVPRGAVPGIGTTEIHDTPGAEAIPGLEIVPLPKADAPADPAPADPAPADPAAADPAAADPAADATGTEAVPAG